MAHQGTPKTQQGKRETGSSFRKNVVRSLKHAERDNDFSEFLGHNGASKLSLTFGANRSPIAKSSESGCYACLKLSPVTRTGEQSLTLQP